MSDLSAPLVRRSERMRSRLALPRTSRELPIARLAFGALLLIGIGLAARLVLVDDPAGGRPSAVAAISSGSPATTPALPPVTITAGPEILPEVALAPEPEIDDVPAPAIATALLPDLVEETRRGTLPRISASGLRPFDAYAPQGVVPGTKPMIAIVVTGLGLNAQGTQAAIDKLPDRVSLAFAPYGRGLQKTVESARAAGHEVFLEVPLEPFDYPDTDPGPDTLLTKQPPRENLDRLFTVMAKFGGYVGIINNMGARFTASAADFEPVMAELGARGLGYLDDGSSNRSLAPQLSKANRVPFGRVDATLDGNPARGPILAELAALEARARENGSAIGIVSALPVSIETISEWARDLADKGIDIVPASLLMKE